MPIRFRCPHCTRLLGIARRKGGTAIRCPQCGETLTVPVDDGTDERDLHELDDLLNPLGSNGTPAPMSMPEPEPVEPAVATRPPRPYPPAPPKPQPRRRPDEEAPLFEQDDVDALLGLNRPQPLPGQDEDDPKAKKRRPVSGMDAMSLDDGPGKVVLSSQKATLLVVAAVILVGLAFLAGFLLGSRF